MAWGLASIRVSLATNDLSDVAFVLAWRGPPRRPKVRCPRVGATHARQLRSRPPKRFTRADPRRCPLSQPGAAFCCASLRCAPGPSSQCASAAASERRCATLLSVIDATCLCSDAPWVRRLPLLAALQAVAAGPRLCSGVYWPPRAHGPDYNGPHPAAPIRRAAHHSPTEHCCSADGRLPPGGRRPPDGAAQSGLRNGICSSTIEFTAHWGSAKNLKLKITHVFLKSSYMGKINF